MRFTPCDAVRTTRRRATTSEQYRFTHSHRQQIAKVETIECRMNVGPIRSGSGITTGVPGLAGPDVVQFVLFGSLRRRACPVFSAPFQRGEGGHHH
jgi:hypothetical protein